MIVERYDLLIAVTIEEQLLQDLSSFYAEVGHCRRRIWCFGDYTRVITATR